MVLEEFLAQAAEYESGGNVLDSVHKLLNILGKSHPFPVIRLKEIKVWRDSGAYEDILAGNYRKRSDANDPKREFEDAFKSYREELSQTKDPLGETINKLGDFLQNAGKAAGAQAEDIFKSVFGGTPFGGGASGGGPFGGARSGGDRSEEADSGGGDSDEERKTNEDSEEGQSHSNN
jgi:hypothetical protein